MMTDLGQPTQCFSPRIWRGSRLHPRAPLWQEEANAHPSDRMFNMKTHSHRRAGRALTFRAPREQTRVKRFSSPSVFSLLHLWSPSSARPPAARTGSLLTVCKCLLHLTYPVLLHLQADPSKRQIGASHPSLRTPEAFHGSQDQARLSFQPHSVLSPHHAPAAMGMVSQKWPGPSRFPRQVLAGVTSSENPPPPERMGERGVPCPGSQAPSLLPS